MEGRGAGAGGLPPLAALYDLDRIAPALDDAWNGLLRPMLALTPEQRAARGAELSAAWTAGRDGAIYAVPTDENDREAHETVRYNMWRGNFAAVEDLAFAPCARLYVHAILGLLASSGWLAIFLGGGGGEDDKDGEQFTAVALRVAGKAGPTPVDGRALALAALAYAHRISAEGRLFAEDVGDFVDTVDADEWIARVGAQFRAPAKGRRKTKSKAGT